MELELLEWPILLAIHSPREEMLVELAIEEVAMSIVEAEFATRSPVHLAQ